MTSPVKFSENFWGENGDQVVENRIATGKKSIDALMVFLLERFQLELHYSKELKKILKKAEEISEIGSLGRAWDQVKEETNRMADLHQNLSQQLRAAVYSPIETFAKEQAKQRKQLLQEMKNIIREYTHLESNIARTKMKYDKLGRELASEKQSDSTKSNSMPKLSISKPNKSVKEFQQAEQEYQAAIQKMISFRPQWEKTLATVYDSLQMLEETRMEMIQHSLEKYVDAHKPIEKFIQESTNNCIEKLRKVNIDEDVQEWVHANKTGTTPPPLPQFIPWNESAAVTPPAAATALSAPPPVSTPTPPPPTTSTSTPPPNHPPVSVSASTGIPIPGMEAALKELKELTSGGEIKPMRKAKSSVSLSTAVQKSPPVVATDSNRNTAESDKKPFKHRESTGTTTSSRVTRNSHSNSSESLNIPTATSTPKISTASNAPATATASTSTTNTTSKNSPTPIASNSQRVLSVPISIKSKEMLIAEYEYEGQDENELSFKEGDKILLLEKHESGWWLGQTADGKVGLFPSNYTVPAE
jgi:hypothetical protein